MPNNDVQLDSIQLCQKSWLKARSRNFISKKYCAAVWIRIHMHASTLPRALKSVENQVGFENLKVNLIIHGCTDESEEISYEFLKRNPANTTIYTADKESEFDVGQTFRQLLINYDFADWHFFLPGDDYWLPGKMQSHVKFISENPYADFYCHRTYKDLAWSTQIQPILRETNIEKIERRYKPKHTVSTIFTKDYAKFMAKNSIGIESSCYGRKLVDSLSTEQIIHPQGDLVFDILCFTQAKTMYFIDSYLTVYEVGKHQSGWNVMLRKDAKFDDIVTSENIKLLTNTIYANSEQLHLVKWAKKLRSKLISEMLWRRNLPSQIEGQCFKFRGSLLLTRDYPKSLIGLTLRAIGLNNAVVRLLNAKRQIFKL